MEATRRKAPAPPPRCHQLWRCAASQRQQDRQNRQGLSGAKQDGERTTEQEDHRHAVVNRGDVLQGRNGKERDRQGLSAAKQDGERTMEQDDHRHAVINCGDVLQVGDSRARDRQNRQGVER
jgi:hypothetical protein